MSDPKPTMRVHMIGFKGPVQILCEDFDPSVHERLEGGPVLTGPLPRLFPGFEILKAAGITSFEQLRTSARPKGIDDEIADQIGRWLQHFGSAAGVAPVIDGPAVVNEGSTDGPAVVNEGSTDGPPVDLPKAAVSDLPKGKGK